MVGTDDTRQEQWPSGAGLTVLLCHPVESVLAPEAAAQELKEMLLNSISILNLPGHSCFVPCRHHSFDCMDTGGEKMPTKHLRLQEGICLTREQEWLATISRR